jgi:hypothetical protein
MCQIDDSRLQLSAAARYFKNIPRLTDSLAAGKQVEGVTRLSRNGSMSLRMFLLQKESPIIESCA